MDEMAHTASDAGSSGAIEACTEEIRFALLQTHFVPTHGWSVLTVEQMQSQIVF